jgi:hypothetical protein
MFIPAVQPLKTPLQHAKIKILESTELEENYERNKQH